MAKVSGASDYPVTVEKGMNFFAAFPSYIHTHTTLMDTVQTSGIIGLGDHHLSLFFFNLYTNL